MDKYDVVVIGGGPGGYPAAIRAAQLGASVALIYPAAIRAAQLGASVALIERDALGGTCLNWGCIPTKTLIASSDLYYRMRHADALGLGADGVSFDYADMVARKDAIVAKLCGGVAQLLKGNKVTVYEGVGSFKGRNRILVANGAERMEIEAGNTIIATGAEPAMPGTLPRHDRIVDSRTFLEREDLPESMIVLGGGIIGMAAQLGVRVTVVEMLDDILLVLDRDIRSVLRRYMEKNLGIDVMTGRLLEDVDADGSGVRGRVDDAEVAADLMLVAVGRRPVTDGLAIENAGIETDETGCIPVDEYCQTRAATVYAIGDVTGGTQLAHRATSQGLTAAENACGAGRKKAETVVPACIFTSPEIGSVGLSQQDAKAEGINVKTGKFMFGALGKAMAIGEGAGFVKWIADPDSDALLGAHAVGPHATELIAEAALAVRNELTVQELGETIHTHPTLAEAWMEAAHAVHGISVHAAPKRRPK